MRRLSNAVKLVVLAILFSGLVPQITQACNLTFTNLISLDLSGPNPVVNARLCIGAGRTGPLNGADGDTFDFAWGFYGDNGGPVNILNFTPAAITSSFTNCTMLGYDVGAAPFPPFFSQGTLYYAMDIYADPDCATGPGFTCITSSALCGPEHQQCINFSFTLSEVPDSIRVFGVEGGGNPSAGCYPNPDMLLDFTSLPVIWSDFRGASLAEGNRLDWSTARETNNDRFEVLRAIDAQNFEPIGTVDAAGNSKTTQNYSFVDPNPHQGENHYKIRQIDIDGQQDETDVLSLSYTAPEKLSWHSVGPQPTHDQVALRFLSEKARALDLILVDTRGAIVFQQSLQAQVGTNALSLDMSTLNPGMYFLRLRSADASLDHKLMKL